MAPLNVKNRKLFRGKNLNVFRGINDMCVTTIVRRATEQTVVESKE